VLPIVHVLPAGKDVDMGHTTTDRAEPCELCDGDGVYDVDDDTGALLRVDCPSCGGTGRNDLTVPTPVLL
jgi:DnaJ-class molecular chaperone